jgi:hypothetical protein
MKRIPVLVESHAGHRADEAPRRFLGPEGYCEIEEVLDRWYQAELDPRRPITNYYKVRLAGGAVLLLAHEPTADAWYLCQRTQGP